MTRSLTSYVLHATTDATHDTVPAFKLHCVTQKLVKLMIDARQVRRMTKRADGGTTGILL